MPVATLLGGGGFALNNNPPPSTGDGSMPNRMLPLMGVGVLTGLVPGLLASVKPTTMEVPLGVS